MTSSMRQTNSASASGGMRQDLAHRLGADLLNEAEHDQLGGEQLQGPVAATLGRIATGQSYQPLLDIALDLDLVWPRRLGPVVQGGVEPFSDKPLADAGDGSWPNAQGGDDCIVGPN
jgi:hypothetical protein